MPQRSNKLNGGLSLLGAIGLASSIAIMVYGEWAHPTPSGAIIPPNLGFFLVSAAIGILSIVLLIIGLVWTVAKC